LTNLCRFLYRSRPPAPRSLPPSLPSDASASCAASSDLLRRFIAAWSLAVGARAVAPRRDAGFFGGALKYRLLESSLPCAA
jgi:hypothetical protein